MFPVRRKRTPLSLLRPAPVRTPVPTSRARRKFGARAAARGRYATGAARGRVSATGRPGTGARPTAERVTGVQGRGWWDQSGRAGSRLRLVLRPGRRPGGVRLAPGTGTRAGGDGAGPGTGAGQRRPGQEPERGGDGPGRSRTRTRHAGPGGPAAPGPGRLTLAPSGACQVSRERFVTQITRQGEHGRRGRQPTGLVAQRWYSVPLAPGLITPGR